MRLGFELSLQQTQKLIMTQELRQAIQILQLTSQELNNYIYEQMEINPVIELDSKQKDSLPKENDYKKEKVDWKEYFRQNEYNNYSNMKKDDDNDYSFEKFTSVQKSLKEHLIFQLYLSINNNKDRKIGEFIIECIDKNGYLNISLKDISEQLKVSEEEIECVLSIIQSFDPVGVASRDLQECLTIQLINKKINNQNVFIVVDKFLDDLANNRLSKIAKEINESTEKVQWICDLIKSLEPKPGRSFYDSSDDIRYITPDATIRKINDEYIVEINDITSPRIKVSNYYKNLLSNTDDNSAINFLNEKLNSAMWIIKSIDQRRNTIKNVVESILKFQRGFFDEGKLALKPLTLKDVADDIEVHESTVSRTVNGKYVQTPRGTFELKYFFSSGLGSSNGDMSSTSIKSIIKNIIEKENTKKPLSDQAIANILNGKNIDISRRTVAKYRDELNIPSSSGRKRF